MFKLPDFFDEMDNHQQQMLLVHLAMAEDTVTVARASMGEYFKEPQRRNTSFYAEGLAWAVQSMALEAVDQMEQAVYTDHLDSDRDPEQEKTWKLGFFQGTNIGHFETACKVIRHGYQALRSHGMRAKKRSEFWDQLTPQVHDLFWDEVRTIVPEDN